MLFFSSNPIYSQISSDLKLITKFNPPITNKKQRNEYQLIIPSQPKDFIALSIDFYQYFISTQDIPSCVFTPSCSHFAEQTIQRFGLIKGVLLTSDRLQRCNNFSKKYKRYSFNFHLKHYNDPVEFYGEI